ncbi:MULTISPECIES: hypothetical protein [unclassified Kitasatospora]|uniref:hypothetical protein n=1 Tax=unclassified Kitasatospora TaxID=2633591 RepID=UPI0007098EF8|nr:MULTISPECIES: hypothetical protein [unclassified Kitasatospora]KQV11658.1 hypothetical protein ASC99_09355 [Kitasatospora sp. Root107]KRB76758.1 hypothetical protein ASE03_14030 [Kitasatospora sp. Root187]
MSPVEKVPALADGRPEFSITYAMATPEEVVWVAHLYGYALADVTAGSSWHGIRFIRDDSPLARRRAAYMRNPQADPSFVPPFSWRTDVPFGFNPPGWHPSVRISGMAPEDAKDLRMLTGLARANMRGPLALVLMFGGGLTGALLKSTDNWEWKTAFMVALFALFVALRKFGYRTSHRAAAARAQKKWGPGG